MKKDDTRKVSLPESKQKDTLTISSFKSSHSMDPRKFSAAIGKPSRDSKYAILASY